MQALPFLNKYKWVIIIALVGVFLFYWYEIRPVSLYRGCSRQASIDARTLLRSKAEIAKGTDKGVAYQQLIDKNMYLRSDYESFLNKCLLNYGLPNVAANAQKASNTSSTSSVEGQ